MRWLMGLGLLIVLGWAQSGCPHLRYILVDACQGGCNEGNREILIFWSGSNGFNTNDLRINFPNPGTTTWCNSCGTNRLDTCNAALISSWNTTCGTTVFQCAGANTNIPPNHWVLLITGVNWFYSNPNNGSICGTDSLNRASFVYDPSNMCGLGTVYVMFARNTNDAGRYSNNPTSSQNRRTLIAFNSMTACSMVVNYRGVSFNDGGYLLIDPSVCIGKTEGTNNVTPPNDACHYSGSDGANGVSIGSSTNCALPGPSILPLLWAYTRVEGAALVWHATGVGGDEEARLTLWHSTTAGGEWRVEATGLPLVGRYPLSVSGFYRLSAPLRDGGIAYSPVVEYRMKTQPAIYPNPAPGGPYLSAPEHVLYAEVINLAGEKVLSLSAPLSAESLRGLPPGTYLVRLLTAAGERSFRVLVP